LNYGIRPGLSVDNGTAYSIDLFGEMHAALVLQRWAAHGASKRGEAVPPPLTVRDMLEFATVRGAQNAALAHKIGTLTPGKEADIVLIRAGDINTLPLTNAVATVSPMPMPETSTRCSSPACRANGPENWSMSTSPPCASG
jgi:5-methylthioadenosine/S-adenosylhomocysteine deaminase